MKKPWLEGMEVISQPVPAWGGWIETFGLTAIVLAASFVTQQNDPFRLGGSFPWPILAPLLAGLRYGFIHGFASALAILATLGVSLNQQWQVTPEFRLPGRSGSSLWQWWQASFAILGTSFTSAGGCLSISRRTSRGVHTQLPAVAPLA